MVKLEDAFSSKKSYDKPRQHLKKQRHYFADEVLSSQSNGFSSSHVWMWELDNKKGWEPKNWCHLTVVLEKTLLRGPWTARWRREQLPTLLWPGEFMGSQSMRSPQSMVLQRVGHDWVTFTFNGLQWDQSSQSYRKLVLYVHWKDWCWSWNSNTLATWCKGLTDWKRPWRWERLKVGGEGGNRGWDGWMASLTWRTRVWANSGRWWRTGKPGVLQSMGSQRLGYNLVTEQQYWRWEEGKSPDNASGAPKDRVFAIDFPNTVHPSSAISENETIKTTKL